MSDHVSDDLWAIGLIGIQTLRPGVSYPFYELLCSTILPTRYPKQPSKIA